MNANLIIAQDLFKSLNSLSLRDQSEVITFITKFQKNPASPGASLERIIRTKAKNMWSARVNRDLRALIHQDKSTRGKTTWVLLYVDHHNKAYKWAEKRQIGRHSVTGAFQIIECVETVKKVEKIIEVPVEPKAPPLFIDCPDKYLLSLGVPEAWLPTLRQISDEDQLMNVIHKLPDDVEERLFNVASGELVTPPLPLRASRPITEQQDLQRRFYIVSDAKELKIALQAPMEGWITFLHPSQRKLVEHNFTGPVKVSGSAGTGKTVVAMHRARTLAKRKKKVLLTSYVTTLCENIQHNLHLFCTKAELNKITVSTVHSQALSLVRSKFAKAQVINEKDLEKLLKRMSNTHAPKKDPKFITAEWKNVIQLQGITSWAEYRRAKRTGRGKGLAIRNRKALWKVFGSIFEYLAERELYTWGSLCLQAALLLQNKQVKSHYDAVIVDEVQDLQISEIRFLRELSLENSGNLMFCGDAAQRIYAGGFSLKSLGIKVQGRSSILRVNYRMTEQIRRAADQLLEDEVDDFDGDLESRKGTRSLFQGPEPIIQRYEKQSEEINGAITQIRDWYETGLNLESIAVFTDTIFKVNLFQTRLSEEGIPTEVLSSQSLPTKGKVRLGTMHRAKGLEFKAVIVVGVDEKAVPRKQELDRIVDPQDRENMIQRARHLLYVAMTRARDELVVSWCGKPSIFLKELVNERI